MTLQDNGTGTRDLRVSYISEVPIWKSTYRILFTDTPGRTGKQTATLQGWSVVDNTTGSDWLNVQLPHRRLTAVLHPTPLAAHLRPPPRDSHLQDAQLTPQTHDSGDDADAIQSKMLAPRAVMAGVAGMSGTGSGSGSGMGGGFSSGRASSVAQSVTVSAANAAMPMLEYQQLAADSLAPNIHMHNSSPDYFRYKVTEPSQKAPGISGAFPFIPTSPSTLITS